MISITTEAASKAREMMRENDIDPDQSEYGLRIGVKAGGCSGLNYALEIVDAPNDNDRVFRLTTCASTATRRAICTSTAPRSTSSRT